MSFFEYTAHIDSGSVDAHEGLNGGEEAEVEAREENLLLGQKLLDPVTLLKHTSRPYRFKYMSFPKLTKNTWRPESAGSYDAPDQ